MKPLHIFLLGLLVLIITGWSFGPDVPPGQIVNNLTNLQVNTITINAETLGPCTMAEQGQISFNDGAVNLHYACNGSAWIPMYNGSWAGVVPYDDSWINKSLVNKTSVPDLNVNSSTWWAGLTGWVANWFIQTGNSLDFDEAKLNATIDAREYNTEKKGDDIYLYNDTDTIYLNETKLNETIGNKIDVFNTTLDPRYVNVDGDTMTGELIMQADLNMSNNEINDILHLHFNTTNCNGGDETKGTVCWNADEDTLDIYTETGQVIQVGRELSEKGINQEGRTLADGSVVALSGALGDNPTFVAADGTNISKSSVVGVLTTECNNSQLCPVTVFGFVNNLDTSAYAVGQKLYINPNEPGNFSITQPILPNNPVWVASVIRVHANVGRIFVYPHIDQSNGFLINSVYATGDVTVQGNLFVNGTISGGYIDKYTSGNFNGSLYTSGADSQSGSNDANSLFQVISDTRGTPQFLIQDGGPYQASFVTRSFIVVNQNNTLLNSSQNNDCRDWGFKNIDCNTASTGADFGVTDDIEAKGLIYADDGLRASSSLHGAYLQLGDLDRNYNGSNGQYDASTDIFCDYTLNGFSNTSGWIRITDESSAYVQAYADIGTFINSSCVGVKNNPAWISNFSSVSWDVYDGPQMIAQKGGFFEYYVGNDDDSQFKVRTRDGTSETSVSIDDDAGVNSHSALDIRQDINNFDGINALKIFMYSSTALIGKTNTMINLLADANGMTNSTGHFMKMDFTGIPGTGNHIVGIEMPPSMDHLIEVNNPTTVSAVYYEGTNITSNVSAEGNAVSIFELDNDVLYVGNTNNFTSVALTLTTGSNADITALYYYCDNTGNWTALGGVSDTTNGFQSSGTISFTNPANRGVCNEQLDGTPFSDTNDYSYIAIQRTRNLILTNPVLDILTIGGSGDLFLLSEDYMKLNPVDAAPVTCNINTLGAIYFDVSEDDMCVCKSSGWRVMTDSTACT